MLKVTGSTMPGAVSLTLLPITVHAAAEDGDGDKEPTAPLRLAELPMYTAPPQPRSAEPEAGQLEESVATLRKFLEPYTDRCRDAYGKIKPKVQSAVRFGNDSYAYLKDPPKDFYPRAGVIGFTGVLGLLLGRGSRIKKLIYPAGLMAVSTSMYYPERAAAIAKSTGDSIYERAVQSYAALESALRGDPGSKP